MPPSEIAELRAELARLSGDVGRGLAAVRIMIAERDARIAVLEERLHVTREAAEKARRDTDTARHDLSQVRAAVELAERQEEASRAGTVRWATVGAAVAKIVSGLAGLLALLWQMLERR